MENALGSPAGRYVVPRGASPRCQAIHWPQVPNVGRAK